MRWPYKAQTLRVPKRKAPKTFKKRNKFKIKTRNKEEHKKI